MRRWFWLIGGIGLLALIGGLTLLAVRARTTGLGRTAASPVAGSTSSPPPVAVPTPLPVSEPTTAPVFPEPTVVQVANATAAPVPPDTTLKPGMLVVTRGDQARDLWNASEGGERVFERPSLYPGSLVTIVAISAQAVAVRTPEGVEGWLHAPAEEVLMVAFNGSGPVARFGSGTRARIVWANGIPLRTQPSSGADKLREQLPQGQECTIQELRGDWLRVVFDDGSSGWVRWYYDGTIYVDAATSGETSPVATAQEIRYTVVGVRVGIGDGRRVRVVVDLQQSSGDSLPEGLFTAPAPQLVREPLHIVIRAAMPHATVVNYLTDRARAAATVTAIATADGVAIDVVPNTPLYLQEVFFFPKNAPESPAEYDRVVADLCFSADCPPLR